MSDEEEFEEIERIVLGLDEVSYFVWMNLIGPKIEFISPIRIYTIEWPIWTWSRHISWKEKENFGVWPIWRRPQY
jgi:hypothetical protein